jgi:hypothetical protein
MDTGIEIVQPIWLDPDLLTDFIDELRESGYRIGVSQYIAVQDLMVALANQGKLPYNPERLRTLLAPILCSSPTEQEDFQYRFDDWVELIKLKDRQKDELGIKAAILNNIKKSRWHFRSLILLFIVSIFSVVFLQISISTPTPKITSQPTVSPSITTSPSIPIQPTTSPSIPIQPTTSPSIPIQPTTSPSIPVQPTTSPSIPVQPTTSPSIPVQPTPISDSYQESQTKVVFFLLTLCLVLLGWSLWWRWRTQLFLERRSTNQQPELHNISIDSFKHNILPLAPFIQIARNLRQRIRISSNDLDINKTIEASLRRGGWLTPIYGFRQILPEYLFLIDRSSFRDHQAKFADEIIDNLRHNGVFFTSYYFDDNPLVCFPSDGVSHPQRLNEIAVKHHQHRLVIITDADKLYDSATGEIETWVSQIGTWSDRAILTPKPVESWGYRELELAQQFIVLPTNPNGFQILGQLFSQGKANFFLTEGNQTPLPEILGTRPHRWIENSPPDTEQIDTVLDSLQQYLGKDGFYWLSACAVYPELHWNITIYLGNAIKTEDGHSLLETSSVINLARLPWFRYGYMPNWFRDRLIKTFTQNQERTIRSILQNLLIPTVKSDRGSFQLKIAKENHRFSARIANSILGLVSRRTSENNPLQDYTFVGFMLGQPKLAVKVPKELSYILKGIFKNSKPNLPKSPVRLTRPSGKSNVRSSFVVVILILVVIVALFAASIIFKPTNLAIADCQIPTVAVRPIVASKKIRAEIFVDGTPSMNGFVAFKDSRYSNTLKTLNTAISEKWQSDQTKFYRFGDNVRDPIPSANFQQARTAAFYPTEAGNENGYSFFVNSEIIDVFKNSGKPSDDSLTIIVTDLTEKAQNMNPIISTLKDKYINAGFSVGILAQRSEYKGKVYDVGLNNEQYDWDTNAPNRKSDPKFYRPFYIVMIGRYANVNYFYERLKESDKDIIKDSKFVIFDQRLISEPFLLNLEESPSLEPEGITNIINYSGVVIEPNSQAQKEQIQLLRLKPDTSYKYSFKTSKSALLQNTLATFGDVSQIKTKIDASRVDSLSKKFVPYDRSQKLVKLGNVKFSNETNDKTEFELQFNPNKNTSEGIYAINLSNFIEKPASLNWLSEWSADEKNGGDGSKTYNVSQLFYGLKELVVTANSDRPDSDKLISKFCFIAEIH